MKNIKKFIFLSNATGGIASFQSNIIDFLLENNQHILLVDKKLNQTQKNIKINKKNLEIFSSDIFKNIFNVISFLKSSKKKNPYENIFIISNTVIFSIYFPLLKILFKKPKILLVHHSHIYNLNFTQVFFGFISSIFSLTIFRTLFVSKFTMNWWNTYFPLLKLSRQSVLYNYVHLPKKIKRIKKNNFNIGFVGRLEKEKGLNTFIKIAKNIEKSNFKFHIFGDGSIKIDKKNIKKINLNKWTQKDKIYNKIDILFVTSKIENCPFNVLEAKSNGIPTITISEGGIKEIIRNNYDGLILKKNINYKHIEKNLNKILNKYKYFSKNCIKNSKKFNAEKYNTFLKIMN